MPDKPLEISLNMTAKELYDANPEYKAFQEGDAQPMGVTFQGYDFPTSNMASAILSYPSGQIKVNNVVTITGLDKIENNDRTLEFLSISFFLDDTDDGITNEDAYKKTMALFKELEDKGWVYNKDIGSPRLSKEDSFTFTLAEHTSSLGLDFTRTLTFEQWMQLSNIHTWQLRHGTDAFIDIMYIRDTDPETGNRHYLMSLDISDPIEVVKQTVGADHRDNWEKEYVKLYPEMPTWRLQSESQAIEMGLKIQQDQPDYTLPLVLEKTGIDTSKFISIDPYKITYEEFIKRSEAGEDMTPYYENQTKPNKPEITSQAKGRCLAGQPCPKSGYWFTLAKSDSRAYFKQGDIMPDYPNNQWGEVIWQFEGEKG
ncbi:hypothetical protein CXF65_06625 [Psychrobacter sp. Sarcosine-3u-12]|nr:hypothetical protein [Psychrobacter sp. Sarcosine-3u-12]PKG35669.1 hypothetical protein CXF65_06625 [Psychrobacter sp. Sarcosine-3u-12]